MPMLQRNDHRLTHILKIPCENNQFTFNFEYAKIEDKKGIKSGQDEVLFDEMADLSELKRFVSI